jgi:hypothetical protein
MTITRGASMPNRVNSFKPRKFVDHTVVDHDGLTVGHIRVKPNNILWKDANGKLWYGITLEEFAGFCKSKRRRQTK